MKYLFLVTMVILISCDNSVDNYPVQDGGYHGVTTYHNEYVYQKTSPSSPEFQRADLYFEYNNFLFTIQAANVDFVRTLQIKVYGWDNSILWQTDFDVNGNLTQEFKVNLQLRPAYVTIDAPAFSGSLVMTMKSINY